MNETAAPRPTFLANLAIYDHGANVGGVELPLTQFEHTILRRLAQAPSECVTRDEVHAAMYGTAPDIGRTSNVIEVVIYRLRKKLAAAGAQVAVRTHRGIGYSLDYVEPARC